MMVETLTTSDTTKEVGHPKGAVRVKNPGVQTGVDAQDRSEPTLLKIEGDTTADQVQQTRAKARAAYPIPFGAV